MAIREWKAADGSMRYAARIHLGGGKYKLLKTHDERALAEIDDAKAKIDRKGVRTRRETVAQFASRWTQDYNATTKNGSPRWSKRCVRDYDYSLKPFVKEFGAKRLSDVEISEVRPWAQKQTHKYVAVARTMMNDALRDGLIDTNPIAQLRLEGSRGRKDIEIMPEAELEQMIDKAEELFDAKIAAMIAMAGYVGLRPGEMFALAPEDVDLANAELHIRLSYNGVEVKAPKNGKARRVIIPEPCMKRLRAYARPLRSETYFLSHKGSMFSRSTFDRYWQVVRASVGKSDMPLYALRHTAASYFLNRGATPEDTSRQLGHTDGGRLIRELYGHPDEAMIRERLKRVWREPTPLRDISRDRDEAANG